MNEFKKIWKQDPVLLISGVVAAGSCFFVPPSWEYLSYIDFRVLALLFCLMTVVAGFQQVGIFDLFARKLCGRANNSRVLGGVLIFLCFFSSMIITNDVALLTFVPFAILVLSRTKQQHQMPYIIVLQTVAANLGSMFTPVGNPQNLYLYSRYQMRAEEFFATTGWITVVSLLLLLGLCYGIAEDSIKIQFPEAVPEIDKMFVGVCTGLLLICLATVFRIVSWQIMLGVILVVLAKNYPRLLKQADFALLTTFVFFFVFVGNMGRITVVRQVIQHVLVGKELLMSVLASQLISNVPSAVLLSGFSENGKAVLLGTNIGGLGTLVASLASLISFKAYCRVEGAQPASYLALFSFVNFGMLLLLIPIGLWLL